MKSYIFVRNNVHWQSRETMHKQLGIYGCTRNHNAWVRHEEASLSSVWDISNKDVGGWSITCKTCWIMCSEKPYKMMTWWCAFYEWSNIKFYGYGKIPIKKCIRVGNLKLLSISLSLCHIKCLNKVTDKAFNMLLKFLIELLPTEKRSCHDTLWHKKDY